MVEYDPEIHEGMAQCDICEDWHDPENTVMVNHRLFILNCIQCKDDDMSELRYMYLKENEEIEELIVEEIPQEVA